MTVGIWMFLRILCLILVPSGVLADSAPCDLGDMAVCQCVDYAQKNKVNATNMINQGRLVEAADILEGILMRCPDQEDVFWDYSVLLSKGLGESKTLSQNNLKVVSHSNWFWHKHIGVRGGYTDNLGRAPSNSIIEFNFQPIDLMPDFRIEEGFLSQVNVGLSASQQLSLTDQWLLNGDIYAITSGNGGFADYQRGVLGSQAVFGLGESVEYGVVNSFEVQRYANDQYFLAADMVFEQRFKVNNYCYGITGQDFSWQRQVDLSVMDNYYTGLRVGLSCAVLAGNYQLELMSGGDWGEDSRPGGDRWRNQARISALWPVDSWVPGSILHATVGYLQVKDSQAYLKLLNIDDKRQVEQFSLKATYQWPVVHWAGRLVTGHVDFNWQRGEASIPLFGVSYFEILTGISLNW
ncbi:MAG: hypothetical protein HOE45_06945 [Gammaproteobacteria bacterium]|nr:hypothetical protein [Gammaproteobacteria bacterium]